MKCCTFLRIEESSEPQLCIMSAESYYLSVNRRLFHILGIILGLYDSSATQQRLKGKIHSGLSGGCFFMPHSLVYKSI